LRPFKKFNPKYCLNYLCCQIEEVYFVNLLCNNLIPKELIKFISTKKQDRLKCGLLNFCLKITTVSRKVIVGTLIIEIVKFFTIVKSIFFTSASLLGLPFLFVPLEVSFGCQCLAGAALLCLSQVGIFCTTEPIL
jgi:glucose-6-phosphate dehydrogenase assembly protein OpcA